MTKNRPLLSLFICLVVAFPLLVRALPGHAQGAGPQSGLGIAAVVNDDVISILDLGSRVTLILKSTGMAPTPENRRRVRPQVLRNLIDEKLMQQEATRAGVKVSREDIYNRLKTIAANNNMTVNEMTNSMTRMGVASSVLSTRIEAEISWRIYVVRKLARPIKIADEEINDEIKRIQSNAGKPEFLLAEIFLPVDTAAQDGDVRQLGMRLLQEMKNGASFKTLASNFSRSPSAAVGGDMGWVQFNYLAEELQSVVQKLKPGQVSPPIRSIGGYYLILLRNKRNSPGLGSDNAYLKLAQLHVSIPNMNDAQAVAAVQQRLVTVAQNAQSCTQLEALDTQPNYPFAKSSLSGSMGEISLSSLPQNMQTLLKPLPVGKISPPIPTGGGIAVMMVCQRSNDTVDLNTVRQKIKADLKNRRLNIAARRRLHDLRRDAFVDIRL